MKHYTLFFVLIVFFNSCKTNEENYKKISGYIFGTTYHIIYKSENTYQKSIDSLFVLVNKSLSTYIPTSDISKINKNDTSVVVDDFFVEVFKKSKRIYRETNGYFDPTFAKVIDAYGFGSGNKKDSLTEKQIKHLMQFVGFENIRLKNRKIYKKNPEVELNVNAIAKGYGIDVIGRFLEQKGIENYLIEIGGEIRARGVNSRKKDWKIAIDDPNTNGTRSQSEFITLKNQSVASSGNYRKYRIGKDGRKYVHILNPKTGLARESDLISATVISNGDCADVDAYATAFMAMGFEKTKYFVEKNPNIQVLLTYIDSTKKVAHFSNFKH